MTDTNITDRVSLSPLAAYLQLCISVIPTAGEDLTPHLENVDCTEMEVTLALLELEDAGCIQRVNVPPKLRSVHND